MHGSYCLVLCTSIYITAIMLLIQLPLHFLFMLYILSILYHLCSLFSSFFFFF
ncbi:MAG: hypothetical protein J3Q66DRAFT_335714, partial [Benniella sp.]